MTDRYAIGLEYQIDVEFTQLIPKDESNKPIVTDRVYLESAFLSYIDSGPINIIVEDVRTGDQEVRDVRSDYGFELGKLPIGTTLDASRVYTETGRRLILTRGRAEDIKLKLSSNTHLGIRLAAISQEGTVIP